MLEIRCMGRLSKQRIRKEKGNKEEIYKKDTDEIKRINEEQKLGEIDSLRVYRKQKRYQM